MKKFLIKIRQNLPWQFKYLIFYFINYFLAFVYFAIRIFTTVDSNKVMIRNYDGQGFGDNAKAIVKYLISKNKKIKIIWLVKKDSTIALPDYAKTNVNFININSIMAFYHVATSKVWISNTRIPYYYYKRKNQVYIQTWHAGVGLKKVEKGAIHSLSKTYIASAKKDSKQANLFISNSRYRTNLYRKDFWYFGKVLEKGLPRNDIFFHKLNRQNILDKMGLPKGKKYIIYAPTFRKNHNTDVYDIDVHKIRAVLAHKFGGEWVVLLRFHHIVSYLADEYCKNDNKDVINITSLPDIYEILPICDFLITDYSSIMFDYMLTKKPILIYAKDIEEYTKDRNFNLKLTDLPFKICESFDDLLDSIKTYKFNAKIYNEFLKQIGLNETGHASECIGDYILSKMEV